MASNLLSQVAERTATFLKLTGLTQTRLSRHLNISDSSLSQFLSGYKGLESSTLIRLCQVLSLSKAEVSKKFSEAARSSKILNFQSVGRGMELDDDTNSGWYPGTDGSGAGRDPNDGRSIDDAPDADTARPVWDQALIDTLREARGYHRQACRAINKFINRAKVNAGIVTPSGVSQKFSASNSLKALHTKLSTRVLTPEDQEFFLNRDLAKLKELTASIDDSERSASVAEKRKELNDQAAELKARRIALKNKYAR